MRAVYLLALLLLVHPLAAENITLKIAPELTREEFLQQVRLSTGEVILQPVGEARMDQPVGIRIDADIPRERSVDFLFDLVRLAEMAHIRLSGVTVVKPLKPLATVFRVVGTEEAVEFSRSPLAGTDRANSLTAESVKRLLGMLEHKTTRTDAIRILARFGPRSDAIVDALVGQLGNAEREAVSALGHLGFYAKRALPTLRKLPNARQYQPVLGKIELAKHPDLTMPGRCRGAAPESYRVIFKTSKGAFVVQVHREWAPLAADRFYHLVRVGFFDDTAIFRTIENFITQWGKSNDPQVNAAWTIANLKDEKRQKRNTRGRLAFAKAGRDSRSTQVFINLADNPTLDKQQFAPFAEVVEGMDVVDQFYAGYANKVNQGRYHFEGKPYIQRNFPKLDRIRKATLVPAK